MDNRPEIDLRVLYYFTILAEEKHFGNAAKRIGIEQPPLSLQIKKLEDKLGGKLFDRSNKRVKLTESGEALLPEAIKLLASANNLVQQVKNIHTGEAGVLRIGFTSSTIFCGIPAYLQQFKQIYPQVQFVLRELSPAAQLSEIGNGTLDLAFIREPEPRDGIRMKTIWQESFVAVLSHDHSLAHKTQLKIKELAKEPFVLFPRTIAPALYHKLSEIFAKAKFYPNVVQEAFEWQTIVNLVEANLGVSICPSSFQKLKIGGIKYIPLTDVKTETGVSVCVATNTSSKLVRSFLKMMEEQVK